MAVTIKVSKPVISRLGSIDARLLEPATSRGVVRW
jgi:hypothetical protein